MFEKCAKIVRIAKLMKTSLLLIVLQITSMSHRTENFDLIFISQKLQLKQAEECMYINYDPLHCII